MKFTEQELCLIKRCVYKCVPAEAIIDLSNYTKSFSNTHLYKLLKKLDEVKYDAGTHL